MKGYFDRIEDGGLAVILVEEQKKEWIIPVGKLPQGSKLKTWFELVVDGEHITSIEIDHEKTSSQEEKVNSILTKLRSKSKGSQFRKMR